MTTNYLEFFKMLDDKHRFDKEIAEKDVFVLDDFRERINFYVSVESTTPASIVVSKKDNLIMLDEDDLKYLYDKYSKRLIAEMEKNIEGIRGMYGAIGAENGIKI